MSAQGKTHPAWIECHQCHHRRIAVLDAGDFGDALECPECDQADGWLVRGFTPPSAAELRRWPADERDMYLRAAADYAVKHGYPEDNLDGDIAAQ